jgi:ABC-2 type transport system permease protein
VLNDVLTVLRKETLEILMPDGRFQGGARNVLILVGIAGVLFPLQAGAEWMTSWITIYSACFPAILLLNYAVDTFAGERERHTLETLLATRLPAAAILLGKTLAITLYGWGLILTSQAVAVVAVNLAYGRGRLLFFTPGIFAGIAGIGLLLPLLLTTVAITVSLTAPTARAAGQRMLVPFLAIYGLPSVLPLLARRLNLPLDRALSSPALVVLAIGVCCAAGSAAALAIARWRFTRDRLMSGTFVPAGQPE